MDKDRSVFNLALAGNVFIQQTNWENDDPGQKSIPRYADPCSDHSFDLHFFHQRHFNNTEFNASAFSIAVFPAVSFLQKKFYPQFNLTGLDYSFIAALKLKLQETHWRKGHKFVQIVIQ